jgi:hypothetical protein
MNILEFAKSKIQGVLDTLEEIKALDFPFAHATEALLELEHNFADIKSTLDSLGPHNAPLIVQTTCQRALDALARQLPAIGFIARSTEVSGPVEFHGPFLRVVRQAIAKNTRLVISSEWDFSPYTFIFPELFREHQFVLVGLPVSESDNALITPLAGHELGHNVWEQEHYDDVLSGTIYQNVKLLIEGKFWPRFKDQFGLHDKTQIEGDMFGLAYWENTVPWALAQSEELFCDCIGLLLFREAYLYAFAYLVAPWGFERTERRYPSMRSRIEVMTKAAIDYRISVPTNYSEVFLSPEKVDDTDVLLAISDEATLAISNTLINLADSFVQQKSIAPDITDVASIDKAFRNGIPATGAKSIASILIAGWNLRAQGKPPWTDGYPVTGNSRDWHNTLNELLLKSFEVFEIEQRQKTNLCSTTQPSLNL